MSQLENQMRLWCKIIYKMYDIFMNVRKYYLIIITVYIK